MEKIEVTYSRRNHAKDVREGADRREFPAVDSKGRRFGARASKFICTYERVTTEVWAQCARSLCQRPAGRYYGFTPHAERDGKSYGASQSDQIFETEAERDAAVEAYFAGAEKRAMKNKARAR